ncbi:hypothetical protein AAC387_Pa11g1936 [Persea americana]
MAPLLSFFLLLLSFISSSSSAPRCFHRDLLEDPIPPEILQACNATRFQDSCKNTLSQAHLPTPPKPIDIILASIQISSQNLQTAQSMVKSLADKSNNINLTTSATFCLEGLNMSQYRLNLSSSNDTLPRGRTKDARAWMSAALTYQYDCFSGLKKVNNSKEVSDTMASLLSLTGLTSNALSMLVSYDLFGNETGLWKPPLTERSGFWGDGVGVGVGVGVGGGGAVSGFLGGGSFPLKTEADVTVCKDGEGKGCSHPTVQSAVDAGPAALDGGRRFVIYIKEGVYEEIVRVPLEKKNVVFLGDGMGKTVITGNLSVGMVGVSTPGSATVAVIGDGFMARDLTIQNTAGPIINQALAFRSDSDLSLFYNCEFLGQQDTLLAHSLRQLYKSCHIAGTVDFIFGNSAAIFEDSLILILPRLLEPEKGENNVIAAHGRTDPAQSTGFVFQNCTINGTADYMALYNQNPKVHKNFLGRPWKEYSRTVFIHSYMDALISPEGWMAWDGDFALLTLYYAEFENVGPGANVSARVNWSSQIPPEHVSAYSLENFIQGDEWMSSGSK